MVRGLVFLVFLFSSSFIKAAVPENIRFYLVLVNLADGNQIKSNYDLKITVEPEGKELLLITDKKGSYYEVPRGKSLKVKVSAVGFYPDQKIFESQDMSEGDVIEIKMNPKPSGSLIITTIDNETKDPVYSEVEIVFFSRINKEQINESNPQINYFYELKGKYKITTKAKGYLNDARILDLDISDGQLSSNLVIELTKNRMTQTLEIVDKSTNEKLTAGTASIKHKETGQKVFEGKIVNGIITFDANRNDNYVLTIKANGYSEFTEPFILDGKNKKYGITPNSSFLIDTYDDESNNRIGVELEITSPSGKKSKVISSNKATYNFIPNEIGTYTIESKANGYINKTGTLIVKSMAVGSLFYTLRLKKGNNEFIINTFDDETKTPINNAVVKVFSEQSKEVLGKSTKNQKIVNLDLERKYFFEVSAPQYHDYTANVASDRSIQVYLKKKKDEVATNKMVLKVIDEQTKLPIKDARLRLFENNAKAIPLVFDAKTSEHTMDKLDPNSIYSFEATAKGYFNLKETINKGENQRVISLSPADLTPFYFEFYDGFTSQKIDANLKLHVEGTEIKTEIDNGRVKAFLSTINTYRIEVFKTNYSPFSKIVDKKEAQNGEFKVNIFKENYEILFKTVNILTDNQAKDANLKIKNKETNDTEEVIYDLTKKAFIGSINPENSYSIEISVPDFEPFTTVFLLKQANPTTLDFKVMLKAKPKSVEKKPEPEKVKPKPIEKVETPKPVVQVEKKNDIALVPLDIKKGVKYPLDGVNFTKSKTTLVPGAEVKLDAVVAYLKANPKTTIEVAGHTDNEGADQRLNQRLSEFRARVVANYLFNKGISSGRIITIGKGSSEPIVPNDTDENKARNRRIEILVLED